MASPAALRHITTPKYPLLGVHRSLATLPDLRRPPPSALPDPVAYVSPSRPRAYYARPNLKRDLPARPRPWKAFLAASVLGVAGWGVFLLFATNKERLSSSIVRQILVSLQENVGVRELLGESIRPEPAWYLNGDPYIHGQINQLKGNIDINFRVKGSKRAANLYFTSIRRDKGVPYTVLRFKLIADDGTELHVTSNAKAGLQD